MPDLNPPSWMPSARSRAATTRHLRRSALLSTVSILNVAKCERALGVGHIVHAKAFCGRAPPFVSFVPFLLSSACTTATPAAHRAMAIAVERQTTYNLQSQSRTPPHHISTSRLAPVGLFPMSCDDDDEATLRLWVAGPFYSQNGQTLKSIGEPGSNF